MGEGALIGKEMILNPSFTLFIELNSKSPWNLTFSGENIAFCLDLGSCVLNIMCDRKGENYINCVRVQMVWISFLRPEPWRICGYLITECCRHEIMSRRNVLWCKPDHDNRDMQEVELEEGTKKWLRLFAHTLLSALFFFFLPAS